MLQSIILQAPAKVNYRLDVIARRPDGYHELRMIMQRVNLCDQVSLKLVDGNEIKVSCGREGVPDGEGNIAWKAARALLDLAGQPSGVEIAIQKNIPVAAGLGGGSSDCAAVLLGLNELLGLGLSCEQLMEIGVKLGADVPFFVFQQTALAEGIGEKLTPLTGLPPAWVVLVNPNLPVSTAWVYKNLQLTQRERLATIPDSFEDVASICRVLSNDLESVTIPAFPVISEIKDELIALGACCSLMSGSGPTVFGLFDNEATARAAGEALRGNNDWFVAVVETV
ncbi:4-(cytidine 5'-diphospho)-2-C-methyl-D-erythritol kinase [Trichlorobacter lovleyi]|uniref:4-(cytidine 5'-diphospho)-2-C-methyl-D-erythritol kinase n=1 Tax=Trichlorobacter lovleyi TaxID=313985 RepID=UPI002240A70E|nr:4-(cytidine 5'-diphospho)-2-C-methyl-D-erythritol kinase [Trichlorobacter lovleyi]QOX79565.1 4-(cytidine 5'-diphospho)-2-C-methyl-D-erythritol kinase [Trichlorobacter lovleyi]